MVERRSRDEPTPARSLVIPMYRERSRIRRTLAELAASARLARGTELILVDDGSDDDTRQVALDEVRDLDLDGVVMTQPHLGKGAAVATGMLAARGAVVAFTDADLSTGVADIDACVTRVEAGGADVVVGTRSHPDSRVAFGGSPLRKVTGWSFNCLVRRVGLTSLQDTQCGLKGFRREAVRPLFHELRIRGFAFDIEVLARAQHLGLRVAELPVDWAHVPASRVRIARDAPRMLLDVLRVRDEIRSMVATPRPATATAADDADAVVLDLRSDLDPAPPGQGTSYAAEAASP